MTTIRMDGAALAALRTTETNGGRPLTTAELAAKLTATEPAACS